ncbi:MAG: hypothetical protein J6B17_00220 [Ruminococcus sp.]|nr:hypothetical protein [Ruminococcus sp.]
MAKQKILAAGGDLRMIYAAEKLSGKYDVMIMGFDDGKLSGKGKRTLSQLAEVNGEQADFLFLPPLTVNNKGMIPAPYGEEDISPEEIAGRLKEGGAVLGGNDKGIVKELCGRKGIQYIDYINSTSAAQANAVPTAEGAIKTAMEVTGRTMWRSRVLVTGGGRIGTLLTDRLCSMGAKVTAAARKRSDRIRLEAAGAEVIEIPFDPDEKFGFDIIFNTIPAEIFGEKEIERIEPECAYVELASVSGGVTPERAAGREIVYVSASGLPAEDTG